MFMFLVANARPWLKANHAIDNLRVNGSGFARGPPMMSRQPVSGNNLPAPERSAPAFRESSRSSMMDRTWSTRPKWAASDAHTDG
jgi:hypothetical protein